MTADHQPPPTPKEAVRSLRALVSALDKVEKAEGLSARAKALEAAIEQVQAQRLEHVLGALSAQLSATQKTLGDSLTRKREVVLQSLESKGVGTRRMAEYDRAGPLRITHKGVRTTLRFGNLELKSFDEPEGQKTADLIAAEIKLICQGTPQPEPFGRLMEAAIEHLRVEKRLGPDSWLRLTDIYRELWLSWHRNQFSGKFPKGPKILNFSIVQFAVSLSQWVKLGAKAPSGAVFRMRPPPMAQEADALLLPDLANPERDDLLLEGRLDRLGRE